MRFQEIFHRSSVVYTFVFAVRLCSNYNVIPNVYYFFSEENYSGTIIGASMSASVVLVIAVIVHMTLRYDQIRIL